MATPAFVDAAWAADSLHVPVEAILDLVRDGKLRTFGGRAANPFIRSADLAAVAEQLGLGQGAEGEPPRRVKSPTARVQQRITADSRWGDVSDDDLRAWAANADPARRQAAIKAGRIASDRLRRLLDLLEAADS